MGRSRARPSEPVLTGLPLRWRRSRWYGPGFQSRKCATCALVRSPTVVSGCSATCAAQALRLE
eukprot:1159003-Alexandrium_andersonii.AAC.1